MGLFSSSSPFDSCVERATSEKNTSDDWSQIMDVCDKVKESPNGAKDCLKSITKRINNDNPRVVLQTVTLLDACINNCGRKFLLEVAGREFEQDLQKFITSSRTHPKVSQRLRESLKKWAEGEFKGDPELSLIPALYSKLQKEGCEFDFTSDSPKKTQKYSNDPNVVNSAQEEEDIAKAIQLSLQDGGSNARKYNYQVLGSQNTSGLYSSASAVLAADSSVAPPTPEKEPMKVRALYDFEAAEDNELTFKAGELIIVIDDSDANWWKGSNHRGEGLFPANFVTSELEEEQTYRSEGLSGKHVSFSECVEVTEVEDTPSETAEVTGEVDEDKIDQLLHLLHEADPTGERGDDPSLPVLEEHVNAMAPNIDAELERIDKKHAQLARISTDLVDALNLYHQLMREIPSPMPYYSPYKKIMANPASGLQSMTPPHFLPSNPQNLPPQQVYAPSQYPFVGPPVSGVPQYLPPHMAPPGPAVSAGHLGSPSHHPGTSQPPVSSYQPGLHESHGATNAMPTFNHFGQGVPSDYGGIPGESSTSIAPPSSSAVPVSTQVTPANVLAHGFPPSMPPQGHPMGMPQAVLGGQGNIPSQGPVMNIPHQGVMPPQAPPVNMPPQGPPASLSQSVMAPPGPPTSMSFYTQPHLQQMQQPLM